MGSPVYQKTFKRSEFCLNPWFIFYILETRFDKVCLVHSWSEGRIAECYCVSLVSLGKIPLPCQWKLSLTERAARMQGVALDPVSGCPGKRKNGSD